MDELHYRVETDIRALFRLQNEDESSMTTWDALSLPISIL